MRAQANLFILYHFFVFFYDITIFKLVNPLMVNGYYFKFIIIFWSGSGSVCMVSGKERLIFSFYIL